MCHAASGYNELGIDRSRDIAAWNVCPWYVGTEKKILPVNRRDMEEARPYLEELIGLLPDLRCVVLLGLKAQKAWSYLDAPPIPDERVLCSWHPSPKGLAKFPARKDCIRASLCEAKKLAGAGCQVAGTSDDGERERR